MSSSSLRGPQPQPQSSNTRVARKSASSGPRYGVVASDADDEDDEGATITIDDEARRRPPSAAPTDASTDHTTSTVVVGRNIPRTRSQSNATTTATATSRRPGKATGRGKTGRKTAAKTPRRGGKTLPAGKRLPADYPNDGRDDGSDMASVRSLSPAGNPWEVEKLDLGENWAQRVRYHSKFRMQNDRADENERIKFARDDIIWICPDPEWLPEGERNRLSSPSQLHLRHWWLAEIVDCCTLDDDGTESTLGFLKIRWFYNVAQLWSSQFDVADYYSRQLAAYNFRPYEFIYSDHYDFVGLESYAGHAPGFLAWVELRGLQVPDDQILQPPELRPKIRGKQSKRWLEGFNRRGNGDVAKSNCVAGFNSDWKGKGDRFEELDDVEEEEEEETASRPAKRSRR